MSSDSKSVTEGDTAAALNTSGQLTITDPDTGEAHVVAQTNAHGTYGDFSIDANGAWTYTGNGAHDELTAGQQVQDQFTVTSQDGTASGTVTVTITGTNDAATVSSDSKSVTEGDTAAALNTSGQLTITDPDTGEAHVVAQTNAHGTYGDFSIDANGAWTYTGNGAHNELTAGQQVQDQFTVTSQDGTASGTVTVTITGTNDAATVSSDSKSVTEGDTAAALNTSGQLTITDPDTGEAHVVAQTNAHGTYGDFSIDANGAWTYTGNGAHDELTAGQQVQDQFTVTSQDGTATGTVTVKITGTNDAAIIGDPTVTDVTEDVAVVAGNLTATGTISISDVDTGEEHFNTTVTGAGNLGSLTLAANGSYTCSVANSAVQFLAQGDTKVDTFTVAAADGTSKLVSFTIHGTNEGGAVVDLNGASGGTNNTISIPHGFTSPTLIAPVATITDQDSTTLASMTITLTNPRDNSEGTGGVNIKETLSLSAAAQQIASQDGLTVTFTANGNNPETLLIQGFASVADYRTILEGVQYSDSRDW